MHRTGYKSDIRHAEQSRMGLTATEKGPPRLGLSARSLYFRFRPGETHAPAPVIAPL